MRGESWVVLLLCELHPYIIKTIVILLILARFDTRRNSTPMLEVQDCSVTL